MNAGWKQNKELQKSIAIVLFPSNIYLLESSSSFWSFLANSSSITAIKEQEAWDWAGLPHGFFFTSFSELEGDNVLQSIAIDLEARVDWYR